jgi:GntR family transcriptional regulator
VQFGAEHRRVVQSIEETVATGELARELGCEAGTSWLRVSSLRMVADEEAVPIGWTDVYVDPRYAEIGELVEASPDSLISSLIEEHYGRQIAEIQQDVRAFAITDRAMADRLQMTPGGPALKILRRYLDADGVAFEISVSVHPADRFWVSMRLRR